MGDWDGGRWENRSFILRHKGWHYENTYDMSRKSIHTYTRTHSKDLSAFKEILSSLINLTSVTDLCPSCDCDCLSSQIRNYPAHHRGTQPLPRTWPDNHNYSKSSVNMLCHHHDLTESQIGCTDIARSLTFLIIDKVQLHLWLLRSVSVVASSSTPPTTFRWSIS